MVIASLANERVRYARSLHRERVRIRERRFLIEGVRLVEEALRAGTRPVLAFHSPELTGTDRGRILLADLTRASESVVAVSPEVMASLSETVTPQGVVAVVPMPELLPSLRGPAVVLDGLRDPGNVGTILRTAWAAGAGIVIVLRGTADPYASKVVRSGMGAHFHVPIRAAATVQDLSRLLDGRRILLAHPAGRPYWEIDWRDNPALIVGGEARGSELAAPLAQELVAVPMSEGVESLNAAVAAGVLLFEALRQRATASDA